MKKNHNLLFATGVLLLLMLPFVAAVKGFPDLHAVFLNQDPARASAGDVVTVKFVIQNAGDADANNVLIEAIPDYPFSLLDEASIRQVIPLIPKAPAAETRRIISYRLKISPDATQGTYKLSFKYSTTSGKGWTTTDFNIDVTSKQFAQIFYIDKTKILPGKETSVLFTITNVGNAPLRDLIFSWKEPNNVILPAGTDNTRFIKTIEPGQSMPLNYTLIASLNANPDLYTINLNLAYNYVNANGTNIKESISSAAGMYIGGETDFDVAFSESTQGQTSLSVSNVGSNPAQSVTVSIPQQQGFRVTGTTNAIVGNLNKGDYTVVSFQITPTNMSNGGGRERQQQPQQQQQPQPDYVRGSNNDLTALIQYTDTTGVRHTVEKKVPIQFRNNNGQTGTGQNGGRQQKQQTNPSSGTNAIEILIVLAAAGGAYQYWKKKHEKKEHH